MTRSDYENLTATNSIIIEAPVAKVWDLLTQPNFKYEWITGSSKEKNHIFSTWEKDGPIVWQYFNDETNKFEDYYRGSIDEIIKHKEITYTIRDAFDEDIAAEEQDEQPDIHEETWSLVFEDLGNKTKLTMSQHDYDSEHLTDDLHDHEETMRYYKEVCEIYIPNELNLIKEFCENKTA